MRIRICHRSWNERLKTTREIKRNTSGLLSYKWPLWQAPCDKEEEKNASLDPKRGLTRLRECICWIDWRFAFMLKEYKTKLILLCDLQKHLNTSMSLSRPDSCIQELFVAGRCSTELHWVMFFIFFWVYLRMLTQMWSIFSDNWVHLFSSSLSV